MQKSDLATTVPCVADSRQAREEQKRPKNLGIPQTVDASYRRDICHYPLPFEKKTRENIPWLHVDLLFLSANTHLFRQTIFQHPAEMRKADPVTPGYGKGSFVVVRGVKPLQSRAKK